MRVANLNGRLVADTGSGFADVERASGGLFPSSVQAVYDNWQAFCDWAEGDKLEGERELDPAALGPPVPRGHRRDLPGLP